MFDDMFERDDPTKMVNDELSCNKYKYNSCPKEIIDFINQVYQQEIKKIDPGRSFFPPSALSDFSEKSRGNGIKQASFHFSLVSLIALLGVIAFLSIMKFGAFLPSGEPNIPFSGMVSLTFIIIFLSIVFLHFWWYGQLYGMQLGTSTTEVVKASWPVFLKWYIGFQAVLLTMVLVAINTPYLILGVLRTIGHELKAHEQVYSALLGDYYQKYFSFLRTVNEDDIFNVVVIADIFILSSLLLAVFFATYGFRKGLKLQLSKNKEEEDIEKSKANYEFDFAIEQLKDF